MPAVRIRSSGSAPAAAWIWTSKAATSSSPPVRSVLKVQAKNMRRLNLLYHVGVVQCKDAFYGQHKPEELPNHEELLRKWDAWVRMGCLASEMESAALFIVGGYLRCRVGSVFLTVANQQREKAGQENIQHHDTEAPIRAAIEALRELIKADLADQKA